MRKRSRYKFRISISREGYENNDIAKDCCVSLTMAKKWGHHKIAFKEHEVTVSEFLDYAIQGYAFCHLFRFDVNEEYSFNTFEAFPVYKIGANKGYFKVHFKSNQFFRGAQAVFVDIDIRDTNYKSIDKYVSRLKRKPTCAFYSYTDKNTGDGIASQRFQLVYVFNSILNNIDFETMTYRIYKMIEDSTGEVLRDLGVRRSQYIIGGNNPHTYNSFIIYSVDDFPMDNDIFANISTTNAESQPIVSSEPIEIRFTDELVYDMRNLSYKNVVRKWDVKGFEYIVRTPIDFNGEDYKIVNEDYVELRYSREKLKDGQQRRKNLFTRAALRRLIKSDITADELLYNLFIDRERFFDNSDYVLSIRVLQNCVETALRTDIGSIKKIHARSERPTFVVNPNASNKHKAIAAARRDITNRYIAKMYDVNATIKDNLTKMNQGGHKVGKSLLYKWCKENNITPIKKPIIEGYNPDLIIEENMAAMKCTKYQVEKAKKTYMESLKK